MKQWRNARKESTWKKIKKIDKRLLFTVFTEMKMFFENIYLSLYNHSNKTTHETESFAYEEKKN